MVQGSRIFITGGAGFIGSQITARLIEQNHIVIFDNLTRNALQQYTFAHHKNLELVVGDVCDFEAVQKAMQGADYVIHCAGVAGINTVCISPTRTMHVNMVGSYNVLECASRLQNIKRVICFSTSEVFGGMAFSSTERDSTVVGAAGEARWTYAVSKLAEEHMALAYWKEKSLPTTVLRPFNIYGPNQIGEGAMKAFVQRALKNETLFIHGDGTQIRAWCYVDDMVDAVLLCMQNPKAVGESFNIGNARSVETIYGLANTVIRVLKSDSHVEFTPKKSADIELRIPCVQKSRDILQFEAKVALEEGILRTAEFYRQHC